ncbi:OmpH family outer membrane protein [bacterium]|nr:OmpH family outer membrane protein [bacterium]
MEFPHQVRIPLIPPPGRVLVLQRSAETVKKIALLVTALALTAAAASPALAQQATAAPAAAKDAATKIGLIDMAKVFQQYEKFKDLNEGLNAEAKARAEQRKNIAEEAKKIAEEIKAFKPGTPQYIELEAKFAQLQSQFAAQEKLDGVNYNRKQAEVFEKTYVEVSNVVSIYAKHFGFTVVIRFNSEPLDTEDPSKLASGLNKLVVFHRPQDDITEAVVEYLNRQYGKTRTATETTPGAPVRK